MSGLNYGSSFRMKKHNAEGVTFMPRIGKWIVRVKKKTPPKGTIITLASFLDKKSAEECYQKNK